MAPAFNLVLSTALCAGSAVDPTPRDGWHAQRHAEINAQVAAAKGQVDVVFIGDSITQGWEEAGADAWKTHFGDLNALNLGISGDRTEHVLWRLENGNLEGITPKAAVVMIGTNNIGHGTHSTADVLAGIQRVVQRIRELSPTTDVLLLDILPRGRQFNEARGRIAQINQALARLYEDSESTYLPIGHLFLEEDGSISPDIMPDSLHLSADGYQRWADAIDSPLRVLLTVRTILSRDEIAVLSRDETLERIREVSEARKQLPTSKSHEQVTDYWRALFEHMRHLPPETTP